MSTALYRRYRPETFADVIGQEHVTAPLMQALRTQRVNHAYLFSGPRGCGKTTSARILARCLNCAGADGLATGPTAEPCGVCLSCQELANDGSGSLDVVEIDAASHGGVDDARELRERATFSPARDRYKVFVIDEAHMVSPQGFNALLKIVEEPPPHVKFVFATTEPEKVIGTIRSRTHHYPFHLVPPETLLKLLVELCEKEKVPVGKGVLPLVVRAGEGSVRDALSVLDQLMAGADPAGLDYAQAVSLLGFTDAALLDDVVDAFAAGDGATVFKVVDRVIASGHDPRRFVQDLLERFRDLIITQALGEGARTVLHGLPEDQLERIRGQAAHFGAGQLSRAADVANDALTEMTGATSPRLHLELLCARVLLPGSEQSERGMAARLDRLERRLGVPTDGSPVPLPVVRPAATAERMVPAPAEDAAPARREAETTSRSGAGRASGAAAAATSRGGPEPGGGAPGTSAAADQAAGSVAVEAVAPETVARETGAPETGAPEAVATASGSIGGSAAGAAAPTTVTEAAGVGDAADTEAVRRLWPQVMTRVGQLRRGTWTLVSDNAQVLDYEDSTLRLGFSTEGLAKAFSTGAHADYLRQALVDVLGLDARVVAVFAGSETAPSDPPPRGGQQGGQGPGGDQQRGRQQSSEQQSGRQQSGGRDEQQSSRRQDTGHQPRTSPPVPGSSPTSPTSPTSPPGEPADAPPRAQTPGWETPAPAPVRAGSPPRDDGPAPSEHAPPADPPPDPDDAPPPPEEPSRRRSSPSAAPHVSPENDVPGRDDPDAEDSGLVGAQVVEQLLGGRVIDEDGPRR